MNSESYEVPEAIEGTELEKHVREAIGINLAECLIATWIDGKLVPLSLAGPLKPKNKKKKRSFAPARVLPAPHIEMQRGSGNYRAMPIRTDDYENELL